MAVSAAAFILAFASKRKAAGRDGDKPGRGPAFQMTSFLQRGADGIRAIGFTRLFYEAFGLFFLFAGRDFLAAYPCLRPAASLFDGRHSVPGSPHRYDYPYNEPANVGLFQFFCIVGLTIFHVEKAVAVGFSIVAFLLLGLPLWLVGFFAMSRNGMTIESTRNQIETMGNRRQDAWTPTSGLSVCPSAPRSFSYGPVPIVLAWRLSTDLVQVIEASLAFPLRCMSAPIANGLLLFAKYASNRVAVSVPPPLDNQRS